MKPTQEETLYRSFLTDDESAQIDAAVLSSFRARLKRRKKWLESQYPRTAPELNEVARQLYEITCDLERLRE